MFKLLTHKQKIKRRVVLPAVAVFGLALGMADFYLARAELTPDLQNQVSQILAAGGDVVVNLSNLAQQNPGFEADILRAAIAAGVECQGLSHSISQNTDDETDDELQRIVDNVCFDGLDTGGSSTSENPSQTSGSETGG